MSKSSAISAGVGSRSKINLDVAAAASALWVLLPQDLHITMPGFFVVFALATLLGVVSHVPGGLGVFDAVILLGVAQHPNAELVVSLLLFRLIYYIAPVIVGSTWDALGDPIAASSADLIDLVWRFKESADEQRGAPVFYQVTADHLPIYLDAGFSLIKLGEEAWVDLEAFTLEGKARKRLRQTKTRAMFRYCGRGMRRLHLWF